MIPLLEPIAIGDPVMLGSGAEGVYGRVVELEGTEISPGIFSIVVFATTHGTRLRVGRFYLSRIEAPEDVARLDYFDDLAALAWPTRLLHAIVGSR